MFKFFSCCINTPFEISGKEKRDERTTIIDYILITTNRLAIIAISIKTKIIKYLSLYIPSLLL